MSSWPGHAYVVVVVVVVEGWGALFSILPEEQWILLLRYLFLFIVCCLIVPLEISGASLRTVGSVVRDSIERERVCPCFAWT